MCLHSDDNISKLCVQIKFDAELPSEIFVELFAGRYYYLFKSSFQKKKKYI